MSPIEILVTLLDLYVYVIIIDIILSWLINFKVVNAANPVVSQVHTVTYKLTNPAYRYIRQVVPSIGGLDLSPLVLFFGVRLVQWGIVSTFYQG